MLDVVGDNSSRERLFVAVPLSAGTRERIATRLRPLPGRPAPQTNWHFTLRFLGDTQPRERDLLIDALRATKFGHEFTIRFSEIGAFPRAKRARIIWLGVSEGAAELIALAAKVESAARIAGFPEEARPFTPHLTLSRVDPPRSVTDVMTSQPALDIPMRVREVVLMRSILGKGPAQYDAQATFPLLP